MVFYILVYLLPTKIRCNEAIGGCPSPSPGRKVAGQDQGRPLVGDFFGGWAHGPSSYGRVHREEMGW